MCNCIAEVQDRMAKHICAKPENHNVAPKECYLDNVGYSGKGPQLYSTFIALFPTKGTRNRKAKVGVYYDYCPFCGKKYDN